VVKIAFEYVLTKLLFKYEDNQAATNLILVVAVALSVDFSKLASVQTLLSTVNSVSTVSNIYTKVGFELLEEEKADFLNDVETLKAELEEAYEFLNVDTIIDLDALTSAKEYRYEEADNFFSRTLNTAPGQMCFDQLHDYVDNNLNLEYI